MMREPGRITATLLTGVGDWVERWGKRGCHKRVRLLCGGAIGDSWALNVGGGCNRIRDRAKRLGVHRDRSQSEQGAHSNTSADQVLALLLARLDRAERIYHGTAGIQLPQE
jgi:hypothetical protein